VFDSRIVAVKGRKGEDKKLAVLTYLSANAGLKSYELNLVMASAHC